jgi:cell division protein FtsN
MNTPIGRDFKRSSVRKAYGRGLTREHWQGFGVGLGLGLVLVLASLAWAQSQLRGVTAALADRPVVPEASADRPARGSAADDTAVVDDPGAEGARFDFYDRLKNSEVVVTEQGKEAVPVPPSGLIDRPGTYVLELGSWRESADAERARAKAARLGVAASVQRVTHDGFEFHRVRIGPFSKLDQLNRTQAALRAADIDAFAIRVGD